jgi:hypothetical protein
MRTLIAPIPTTDERAARADLRTQIARLDGQLTHAPHGRRSRGPHLLSLEELEAERDALTAKLAGQERARAEEHEAQERARRRLEAMLADPPAHRYERVALTELGESGCGVYTVKPRLGLVGMLAGWWEITLSSGCPLCMHVL